MPSMRSRPIAVPLRWEAHRRWGSRRLINAVPDALVPRAGRAAAARVLVRRRGESPPSRYPTSGGGSPSAGEPCVLHALSRKRRSTESPHDRSPLKGR